MKFKKKLRIILTIMVLVTVLYYIFLWNVGKAFENIGESLDIPSEIMKTQLLDNDEYVLFYSPGASFTPREWWVKKNGKIIFQISSHDGQVDDLIIKNGKLYIVGAGLNVDVTKEKAD